LNKTSAATPALGPVGSTPDYLLKWRIGPVGTIKEIKAADADWIGRTAKSFSAYRAATVKVPAQITFFSIPLRPVKINRRVSSIA